MLKAEGGTGEPTNIRIVMGGTKRKLTQSKVDPSLGRAVPEDDGDHWLRKVADGYRLSHVDDSLTTGRG